jgi:ribosomal protein L40E
MRFADGCDGSGEIRPADYAEFCCTTADEVATAVFDLVSCGLLLQHGPTWYSLADYIPWEPSPQPPGYIKRMLPKKLKRQVFDRDNSICVACGATQALTIDHIVPERHGGTDELENLQTLCRRCNSKKGTRRG